MSFIVSTLLAMAAFALPAGNEPGACGQPELAQAFKVPAEETARPARRKPQPPDVRTESDLWKESPEPSGKKALGSEPEAVEIPVEEIEDLDEGKPDSGASQTGLGGWGADVERDSWGDEERIKNAESIPEDRPPVRKRPAPDRKKPGRTPKPDRQSSSRAASAKDQSSKRPGQDPEAKAKEIEKLGESGEILPASGSLADLSALWERRRIHLAQRDFELARGDLERLLQLKRELGVGNMILPANVLVREAERAHKAGKTARAQELLASAQEMAPDLAMVYRAQAAVWFSESPFKLGRVFGAILDAARVTLEDPLSANRVWVNLLIGLLLGLGLAGAVYLLVQFLRSLRLFLHDFHHLFPRGVARLQSGILAVLVLVIPILLHSGLVTVLLFWGLIAWMYQERLERLVTGFVVVLFAVAPLVLQLVVNGLAFPDSMVPDLLKVNRGFPGPKAVARLQARLKKQSDDPALLATLANFYKRTGDLERSRELLSQAIQIRPNSAPLLNNLGNVYFLTNDLDKAVDYYGRAAKMRPDLVEPYFNLSRAYFKVLDLDKGKEHRRYALTLDPERTDALVDRAKSQRANHVVADLPVPEDWLTRAENRQNGHWEHATGHLWAALGGIGAPDSFLYVGGGIVLVYLLVYFLAGKLYLSGACVRCGRPVCRRCTTELRDNTVCGQCFHAFMHKDQVDAKSRISKEIQVRQHLRRKESIARGITFVLPGVGQLIKERPIRGFLFLAVTACVLVQIFLGPGFMRDSRALQHGFDWLTVGPLLAVFLGFYAWAILDMFRAE